MVTVNLTHLVRMTGNIWNRVASRTYFPSWFWIGLGYVRTAFVYTVHIGIVCHIWN